MMMMLTFMVLLTHNNVNKYLIRPYKACITY